MRNELSDEATTVRPLLRLSSWLVPVKTSSGVKDLSALTLHSKRGNRLLSDCSRIVRKVRICVFLVQVHTGRSNFYFFPIISSEN